MGSDEEAQAVGVQEGLCDIRAEDHDVFAALRAELALFVAGVGPLQVGEDPARILGPLRSVQGLDVCEPHACVSGQPPMHHQRVIVHDVRERELVEQGLELCIGLGPELREDLPREAVGHVHGVGLVVPPRQVHVRRARHLPGQQRHQRLQRVGAAINEVTIEDVGIRSTWQPIILPDREEIEKLPVHISDDVDVSAWLHMYSLQCLLRLQKLCRILHQQLHLRPRPGAAALEERGKVQREAAQVLPTSCARVAEPGGLAGCAASGDGRPPPASAAGSRRRGPGRQGRSRGSAPPRREAAAEDEARERREGQRRRDGEARGGHCGGLPSLSKALGPNDGTGGEASRQRRSSAELPVRAEARDEGPGPRTAADQKKLAP
mmetsp:Transcript_42224/g.136498  ORF Transcript_42224/g.136498 Transcript_42224/m.136498 type:complete len:378 (-) Transcript_42224:79-1212(-)